MQEYGEVELDIYSGMPNPSWALAPDEATILSQRLADLPPVPARELTGNLGYRGFIVHSAGDASAELIRVQGGTVVMSTGAQTMYADDSGRQLERWLFNVARPHLSAELCRIVEQDFA